MEYRVKTKSKCRTLAFNDTKCGVNLHFILQCGKHSFMEVSADNRLSADFLV